MHFMKKFDSCTRNLYGKTNISYFIRIVLLLVPTKIHTPIHAANINNYGASSHINELTFLLNPKHPIFVVFLSFFPKTRCFFKKSGSVSLLALRHLKVMPYFNWEYCSENKIKLIYLLFITYKWVIICYCLHISKIVNKSFPLIRKCWILQSLNQCCILPIFW